MKYLFCFDWARALEKRECVYFDVSLFYGDWFSF